MISNTATLPNYLFNYLLACILISIVMLISWLIYVFFYDQIFPKYFPKLFQMKQKTYFTQRMISENNNFEILVQIRAQSNRLLPYQTLIHQQANQKNLLQKHIKQLVNQINNLS